MLEVVFDDSTKAVLSEEINKGQFDDIVTIGFYLSIGNIATLKHCQERESIFDMLWGNYDFSNDEKHAFLESLRNDEKKLQLAVKNKEPIRLWVHNSSDSLCALSYVCYLLKDITCDMHIMKLPRYVAHQDSMEIYQAWHEVPFDKLKSLAKEEVISTSAKQLFYANRWISLMQENSPLRVSLNGNLISVDEDFYDSIIRQKLPDNGFTMAFLIGTLLNSELSGVPDSFIACRIRKMIQNDELEVTQTGEENHPYKEILKRKECVGYSKKRNRKI